MFELRPVVFGGAARFVAGVATFLVGWHLLAETKGLFSIGPSRVVGFVNLGLCLTAGYVATLWRLRPSLHSAGGIEGYRSFGAGVSAMGILAAIDAVSEIIGPGLGVLYGHHSARLVPELLAFTAGGAMTFTWFYSWLKQNERDAGDVMDAIGALVKDR